MIPKTIKSAKIADALEKEITEMLKAGQDVHIPGIGRISVIQKAERAGVNPATGERITIAARRAPKLSPAPALKTVLNG